MSLSAKPLEEEQMISISKTELVVLAAGLILSRCLGPLVWVPVVLAIYVNREWGKLSKLEA
jgi:hypothetical protein